MSDVMTTGSRVEVTVGDRVLTGWVLALPDVMRGEFNGADVLVKFEGCDPGTYCAKRKVRETAASVARWEKATGQLRNGDSWRAADWDAYEWGKVRAAWWVSALEAVGWML